MGRWGVWLCFIEFVKYSTTESPTPLPIAFRVRNYIIIFYI